MFVKFYSNMKFTQAEKGTQSFLKSTIKYYASTADKAETVTVAWDGIMSQVRPLIITNWDVNVYVWAIYIGDNWIRVTSAQCVIAHRTDSSGDFIYLALDVWKCAINWPRCARADRARSALWYYKWKFHNIALAIVPCSRRNYRLPWNCKLLSRREEFAFWNIYTDYKLPRERNNVDFAEVTRTIL